jgi:hypothetical protein
MTSGWRSGKDVEGNGGGLFEVTIPEIAWKE